MYYKILLFTLPIPLVVFIWNSGSLDGLDTTARTIFSAILLLLTVGGYIDTYRDEWQENDGQE